ncbi:hypothetical protein F5Y17DRAFT_246182 [Xylariaceae sp. FL0594]|nr:hypothetical protein F5Y17DRAFT_246182 [Xylariaceae sp. FL0594]
MDLSPPSLTRSPASSRTSNYSRSPSLSLDYGTPDLLNPFYKIDSVYEQPRLALPLAMDSGSSHQPIEATTSTGWSEPTVVHSAPPIGGQDVLPSNYAPYVSVGYDSGAMHVPYSHELYSTHLAHAPALPYQQPPPAAVPSRSPDPASSRHSISYHSASPIPRIKMEGGQDYASAGELSQYPSPRSSHALVAETSSYGSQAGSSGYLSDAPSGSWAKSDYPATESDPYYGGRGGGGSAAGSFLSDRRQQQQPQQQQQQQQGPRIVQRAPKRQTRKLTSKEEANFQCEVDGCGKLFSRSYNYKAHMETHDKKREYPFACSYEDCTKKFVRKTDLQRHHQSVHMKEKNHRCDYCGRLFARKDTLRRHMEDGCSKRFDIGTMDLRGPESYDTYSMPMRPLPSSSGHLMAPLPQLPPMTTIQRGGEDQNSNMADMTPYTRR